jgi:hypothetical protein
MKKMKAKQQTKDTKKPRRKMSDLLLKKDVRGGTGEITITSTVDKGTATLMK